MYRVVLIGMVFGCVPIFTVLGMLACLGMATLRLNGSALIGGDALIAGPFLGLFVGVVAGTFIATTLAFGLWLYSKRGPLIIRYEYWSNSGRR